MTDAQPAWVVAILAGLASFVSPCILPLIPGYLSMISGLSFEQLEKRQAGNIARVVISCILFSLGFSVVFIVIGLSVGTVGQWLRTYNVILNIILGLLVIVFGLFVMGVIRVGFLYQDRRLRLPKSASLWGAAPLGFAFGFGWTPCIGPWVATLIAVAAALSPLRSGMLFAVFSLTLAICFTITGLLFSYAIRAFGFFQRHHRAIELTSGAILVLIGVLMVTQLWQPTTESLNRAFTFLG